MTLVRQQRGIVFLVLGLFAVGFPSFTSAFTITSLDPISLTCFPAHFCHPAGMLPAAGDPPAYDEQIATSFTRDFTNMAYNVTAVAQRDIDGFGPAYLLNGLTDNGYWYQVGLAYDWSGSNTGFNLAYEVFDPTGNSIFPAGGGAGLLSFKGPVYSGDIVLLNLNFSGDIVIMYARDLNTTASGYETYTAFGRYFVGLRNSPINSNGFFTGLMTEQYHMNPYYGGEQFVSYSDFSSPVSSAWLLLDEYDVNSNQVVFSDSTSSALTFQNYQQLQGLSSNGASELADAYVLDTGTDPVSLTIRPSTILSDVGDIVHADFNATASGGISPYTYYFFLDNKEISTFNSNSTDYNAHLNIGAQNVGRHDYYVNVVDSHGYPASSQSVEFTVNPTPTASISPSSQIKIDVNFPIEFTETISGGTQPFIIAWYVNNEATTNSGFSFTFVSDSAGNFTLYSQVTDSANYVFTTPSSTVVVEPDPRLANFALTVQSSSFFLSGNIVKASAAVAGGVGPFTYSWYLNGVLVAQTHSSSYTYTLSKMGSNNVRVDVTDSDGYFVKSQTSTIEYSYSYFNIGILAGTAATGAVIAALFFFSRKRSS